MNIIMCSVCKDSFQFEIYHEGEIVQCLCCGTKYESIVKNGALTLKKLDKKEEIVMYWRS